MARSLRSPFASTGALSTKLVATVVAVGATAGVAGLGTFATFDSTTSADLPTTSGVVSIALGTVGAANRLTVSASDLVAGDTVQRAFDLIGASTDAVSALALTTTAPTVTSVLDTDATDGLQLVIDHCSVAWTEAGPPYTYTCGGTQTAVVTTRKVIQTGFDLKGAAAGAGLTLNSLQSGTDHFRLTLTLPGTAGNGFQNKSSTIRFAFTATQRAQTSK